MRNVISTISSTDVSEAYAEQVEKLLGSLLPERETTQDNEWGQTDFYVRLYSYEAPGAGGVVWAVDYCDPDSRELEETGSEVEAVARYEELVRDAADCLGYDEEGVRERFTTTDVAGVRGPLPQLPAVGFQQLEELLDAPGSPVLYLARDEDGEMVVRVGQESEVPAPQVLVTRARTLHELCLDDDEVRITSSYAARQADHYAVELLHLADQAEKAGRGAAEYLLA
ncbi:hypothetical protein GCM10010218_64220 [Streptomyces mashuensis]|uniref:Uncharacterized protein n=1 Tax=Streptomyces mashuensis TaxID=33904 RepID=A0A919BB07_9ACTN|nr:hypothetical protein [Streptomyces mashuensis]GHF74243.1 hypothetical protein GCM10010218_64220 [Streptomyces mashuensis]